MSFKGSHSKMKCEVSEIQLLSLWRHRVTACKGSQSANLKALLLESGRTRGLPHLSPPIFFTLAMVILCKNDNIQKQKIRREIKE